MKILRHYVIPAAAAAALLLPAAAFGQQAPAVNDPAPAATQQPSHGRHHGGYMRMFRGLNLSDQQKAQMKQIMQQYRQAHPRGSAPDPQARKQMRTQLMNVLTPQQQAQVQQRMQQMRDRRPPATPQP